MADITNPHDKFFRENFSQIEIVKDFLRNYLPQKVSTLLNLDQISLQKDSFIDDEFKEHFSDLLFQIPMNDGGEVYVYTLFEHKSYSDSWVSLQLLRYMLRIWDRDAKEAKKISLRYIIPIVIYHGEQKWRVSTEFAALFPANEVLQAFLPNFQYLIYDLPRYPDEELIGDFKLLMMLLILKYIFKPELLYKIEKIISVYMESKRDRNAEEFFKIMLLYMIAASKKVKFKDIERELNNQLRYIGAENIMMTLAEHYKQEGRQEGRQEGKQEGRQEGRKEGQVSAILRILDARFGELPPDLSWKIEEVDDPQKLDSLLITAISAISIPEFIKNL